MTLTDTALIMLVLGMLWLIYEVRLVYVAVMPLLSSRVVQALERL